MKLGLYAWKLLNPMVYLSFLKEDSIFQQTDIYALLIIILRLIILNMAAMALMSYLSVLYVFRLVNQHMNIL